MSFFSKVRNNLPGLNSSRKKEEAKQIKRALKLSLSGVPRDSKVRLNLGCGDKYLEGYTNVDLAPSRKGKEPDVICDLKKLDFPEGYADEVLSVHTIEHFYHWEAKDVVAEWMRVLKPGGQLILECPNLLTAAKHFLKDPEKYSSPGKEGQMSMWVFYGDPAWQDPLMCHRWGYTPKSLQKLLCEAGFTQVKQEPAQFKKREPRDMRITGIKPARNL